MVQNMNSASANPYGGSLNRVGMTESGRAIYQVIDAEGKAASALSVAQKDCDIFEKSFKDIMDAAPKLEQYAKTTTPEKIKKKQSMSKWIIAGLTGVGAVIPMIKVKGHWLKQTAFALGGAIAGFAAGMGISLSAFTPPGATKMAKATKTLSKLDIQPLE